MIPASGNLLLAGGDTGYNLTRSLRFRASASAYLNRTMTTATDAKKWTWSGWVKRGTFAQGGLIASGNSTTDGSGITFVYGTGASLCFYDYISSTFTTNLVSTQVFRDPSAWYHIVVAVDTTQATSSNRVKMYVNGTQITSFSAATYPALNSTGYINSGAYATTIGREGGFGNYYDGYLTEINFIDGQALTPSSFGSTNALTGVWQPAKYSGSYGTNGFYLPFTDNSALTTSSNVGLGKDFSGNGNYWTTNNISITTGVTYDSMTDVPTLTSATAANFAVLNPLDKASGATTFNANLRVTTGAAYDEIRATLAVNTKNYFEVTNSGTPSGSYAFLAGFQITQLSLTSVSAARANEFRIISRSTTDVQSGTTTLFSPTAVGNGEVIQFAIDVAAGKAWIGRASAWYDSAGGTTGNPATGANPTFTFTATEVYAVVGGYSVDASFNAGQRPFAYTPPTGFVSLNTFNLPTSTILKGNTVMDATLVAGNSTYPRNITNAAGFKPDLLWIKSRSNPYDNYLMDSIRGTGNTHWLSSNLTSAEGVDSTLANVTSLNSDGFTIGAASSFDTINQTSMTNVAWQWQAGQGSTSSNTSGSITSTVSVNASAGFSVVTYTGTSANATVGHGLGVAPQLMIFKNRSGANSWCIYHSSISPANFLQFDTNAQLSSTTYPMFGTTPTAPTSSVFSIGTNAQTNQSATNYVAYCWTPIAGYSAFGSYTGNGSADGPFVYTGFRPRYICVKSSSNVTNWYVFDTARNTYNLANLSLFPNLSNAENTGGNEEMDILSNGFKPRSGSASFNISGYTYIYMAFAENPTKYALAR